MEIVTPLISKSPLTEKLWWKNEESEQILNRGYLLKGETVDGAIEPASGTKLTPQLQLIPGPIVIAIYIPLECN